MHRKKNEYNLKTNVEDTKFPNFFLTNVDVLNRDYNITTFTCFSCDWLCLVPVKYFPENKYFPEILFSEKENIFKCLVAF